jgi:hypothetical protein
MKYWVKCLVELILIGSALYAAGCSSRPDIDDSTPLALVKTGSSWGFIDRTGRQVVKPAYIDAWPFSEGLALVKRGHKLGYIDKTGKVAIKHWFYEAKPFSGGRARVKYDFRWGYIDRNGNMVINPRYEKVFPFAE